MMRDIYTQHGAALAADGIPLHFGDLKAEYEAALENAVLLDRNHEGRITLHGKDRHELLNRMSTNDLMHMQPGQGVPTLFTNANARVLDRVVVYARDEHLLVITGPGRGQTVQKYLQRSIFFNDEVIVAPYNSHQFALYGPKADAILSELIPAAAEVPSFGCITAEINGFPVTIGRMKPFAGSHWVVITPIEGATVLWQSLMDVGASYGLRPAGGLTYNTLRIRAGVPGIGHELTAEYIPLELGLWDEVSFNKGCYTGQEIIARMESRNKLARTLVRLKLTTPINAPAELFHAGKRAGMLTSSVTAPDGELFAMGVVKTSVAAAGAALTTTAEDDGQPPRIQIESLLGVQPFSL